MSRKQAGRQPQPGAAGVVVEDRRDPGVEQIAMLGEAAEPGAGFARRVDQRVKHALGPRQLVQSRPSRMPKAETTSPPGFSASTRASSSKAALGSVGKREIETEPRSGIAALSLRISRRTAAARRLP